MTHDQIFTQHGKSPIDSITIDDILTNENQEKKDKNEAYRRLYPWLLVTGRLMQHSTGDESCYTPTIEKFAEGTSISSSLKIYIFQSNQLK